MARTCEFEKGCDRNVWGTDRNTNIGYCKLHQWCRTDNKRLVARATSKNVVIKPARKKKPTDKALDKFFMKMMEENEPVCMECGIRADWLKLPEYKKEWKSCQAHILPKRHFKSIEKHPLNMLVLISGYSGGGCNHHDNYDSNWHKASQMKVWSEVVWRFKILYPLTKPEEHQYIPQILLDTL
jgi:hypothetical protein